EALLVQSIDDLFAEIIFPNYGKITSDGMTLGPTWWAQKLEAQGIVISIHAIESRVSRWRQRARSEAESGLATSPTPVHTGNVRGAKSAIRRHPELAGELVNDPDVLQAVRRALDERYEQAPKPYPAQPIAQTGEPMRLIHEFRTLHTTMDRIIRLVTSGTAVVNNTERDALLAEVRWLRNALDLTESGLNAGSLDQALAVLLETDS
ncbi:MAG: hypothetical protein ACRD0W_21005, partial [Acidimicrobiales bacterium]